MGFRADEVDRIVAAIRSGSFSAVLGGSRLHSTFLGRGGELFLEDFDEGATSERACDERELRASIASSPDAFVEALRAPLRAQLAEALFTNASNTRACLDELLAHGDCLTRRDLLEAHLARMEGAWTPTSSPTGLPSTTGNDAYHAIMSAIGYGSKAPAAAAFGLRFFETLDALFGSEWPERRRYRADFREKVGDLEGAIEDLLGERNALAHDSSEIPYLERQIARLIEQKHLEAILAAPDDDTPRLVWADALSERGNPRGELIVTQCRAARLDRDDPERSALDARAFQLVALHGRDWAQRGQSLERGMVTSAEVRWMGFADESHALFERNPLLRELRLISYPHDAMEQPQAILDDPRVARLPALDLSDAYFHAPDPGTGDELVTAAFGSSLVDAMHERLPALEELTLARSFLRPDDLTRLGARTGLRKLDLTGNAMRGVGDALLRAGGLEALRHLALGEGDLGDDDLGGLVRLTQLASLDLSGNPIGATTAALLGRLPVRRLCLQGATLLGDGGIAALTAAKGSSLTALDLSFCALTNAGVGVLADLSLASLALGHNAFDDAGVAALVRGRLARSIRRLRLGHRNEPRLGPGVARLFTDLPNLWDLDLAGSGIDGDGALALLDALPSIRSLRLGNCKLGDAGLAKLVTHPAFARLEHLELDGNGLGPDAGAILARAPRLPLYLQLDYNRLGDVGARALAAAPAASQVSDLLLAGNEITDDGALTLVRAPSHLTKLGTLLLVSNPISKDGGLELYKELGARVFYSP